MAKYTNIGTLPITVRNITIKPGETKELKGFANDPNLLRYTEPKSADGKGKKKNESKPVAEPVNNDSKSQNNQSEAKNEPEKAPQPESKKDDKQNVKSGGQ